MKNKKKNKFQQFLTSAFCFSILFLSIMISNKVRTNAANQTISVDDGDSLTVQVHPGDTGTIVPNPDSIDTSDDNWYDDWYDDWNNDSENDSENNSAGAAGENPADAADSQEITFEYTVQEYAEQPCITVDASGRYQILKQLGWENVTITGRNSQDRQVFRADVRFEIQVDTAKVKLNKTKVTGYLIPSYNSGDYISYENAEIDIKVKSPLALSDDMYGINLGCRVSSNKAMAYASLTNNVLHLSIYGQKKCTLSVTVSIAGKNYKITVSLKPVKISANSVLLEKGKTKKLKISSWPKTVKWSSSNKKIASVSKNGTVKGKKTGNAVITAKIGDKRIGCAVSVTTLQIKKVCRRASYIGTHWKYSQANRTQSGYYDCSALVWKAYKACAGLDFGDSSYPGTTVTESAWCRDHNRMVKGGYTYKKVDKMKINPGDIVFKSEDLNNPYGTTYHVELFTGYACTGYDSNGKPLVTSLWAAREAGYGAADGSLLARPLK